MNTDKFTITLVSTSNLKLHPDNAPGNFTVQLARQLELEGTWEVAIQSITFPVAWDDKIAETVYHIVYLPSEYQIKNYDDAATGFELACDTQEETQKKVWYISGMSAQGWDSHGIRLARQTLEEQTVRSPQMLGDIMAERINSFLQNEIDCEAKVNFNFDASNKTGRFVCNTGRVFIFLQDSARLARMLGCKYVKAVPNSVLHISKHPEFYMLSTDSREVQSNFAKHDTLYVYTDIIYPQLVGDYESPLLGIVPVPSLPYGAIHTHTFVRNDYLPVRGKTIDKINIRVVTELGYDVPFPHVSSSVLVSLAFKRKGFLRI